MGATRFTPEVGMTQYQYLLQLLDEPLDDECWLWPFKLNHDGYGRIKVNASAHMVHRLAYERIIGPIPINHELDHLCRVRQCFNPRHLEAVTHATNMGRGFPGGGRWHAAKTHCLQGHPYVEGNIYYYKGNRRCRECTLARSRRVKL